MTYNYRKYSFTAFTEADLLQGANGSSIGCGDSFTMPGSASVCISTWDNDDTLSGDTWCNERSNDSSGQKATIDGAPTGARMYAESYHVLRGSDGRTYYLIEVEVEGHDAPGAGNDYFTFYGHVPPAGVTLDVVKTCNVRGEWVDFKCLGAGEKAPANTPPVFTNVPGDGILCVDENTTFVIDLAADDAEGDALSYAIVGGRDAAFFEIDAATGELAFTSPPDYEAPASGGDSNTYDVTVKVSDGNGGSETRALWVKVKDDTVEPVTPPAGGSCQFVLPGEVHTRFTLQEQADGSLTVTVEVLDVTGQIGDLRGVFFEMADESLLSQLQISGDDVTRTKIDADSVISLGSGVNLKGEVAKNFGAFDVGVRLGTPGIGTDDIRSTTFTLSVPGVDLRAEDFSFTDFGVRLTSVGVEGGSREDSLKIAGTAPRIVCDSGTAEIRGRYFCDENDNDVDDGEPGIVGATVELLDTAGAVLATTTTGDDGAYAFTGLDAGDYVVRFAQDASGKVFVARDAGTDDSIDSDVGPRGMTGTISVATGEVSTDNDAGVREPNADPVAVDDVAKFCADMVRDIDILFNDSDPDGDALSVTAISDADETVGVGGTLTLASGATVTLNADGTVTHDGVAAHAGLLVGQKVAEEAVSYTVTDGNGGIGTGNLDITVCGAKATLQMICDALPAQVDLTISLAGSPANYLIDVVDGAGTADDGLASAAWNGICIDFDGLLVLDQQITANVYGPCDTLPAGLIANPENLDNIGWLINQNVVGTDDGNGGVYGLNDLQDATWILSDGTTSGNADAVALADLALTAGEGWVAQEGDLVPIIFDPVGPIDAGGFQVTDTQTFVMGVDWEAIDPDCIC